MITASRTHSQPGEQGKNWQRELAEGYRDPAALLRDLGLSAQVIALAGEGRQAFPMRVPRCFAARMERGNPADPLLRQVLPLAEEDRPANGFVMDPVGDMGFRRGGGVLKKYRGRALLITTGACAIHCRYCFRRHFPYAEEHAGKGAWQLALDTIARDSDIREVILSGGDPLSLSDDKLAPLLQGLAAIPHVHRLRIHTRLPVVLPNRVTKALQDMLAAFPGPVTVVLHANHGHEIDGGVGDAVAALRSTGALLLNQAVLLKGINDSAGAQTGLSDALTAIGVAPYYLHQLDPVAGAGHFQVSDETARQLMAELREALPGYMLPRLVREIPGEASKTPLQDKARRVSSRPLINTGK